MNGDDGILLTGATGFLGGEVLARLLERDQGPVFALVRADDDAGAQRRLRGVLESLLGSAEPWARRVTAVAGDITRPDLGLDPAGRERLAAGVGRIIHCAASVSFTLGDEESRAINVDGTRRVLELARLCADRGGLEYLMHVSTAYVAGDHSGRFREDDLDLGQTFRNAYERSKFEAERLVREHRSELPVQIVRPSIVVGRDREEPREPPPHEAGVPRSRAAGDARLRVGPRRPREQLTSSSGLATSGPRTDVRHPGRERDWWNGQTGPTQQRRFPMPRPLREATTYLAIAFSIAIGIAVAMPHAHINVLLSAFAPVVALVVITFATVPRGERRAMWGEFGLKRSGKHMWAFALFVPMLLAGSAYGAALVLDVADLRDIDITTSGVVSWTLNLVSTLAFMTVLFLSEELGWRGYMLPRIQQLTSRRRAALVTGFGTAASTCR